MCTVEALFVYSARICELNELRTTARSDLDEGSGPMIVSCRDLSTDGAVNGRLQKGGFSTLSGALAGRRIAKFGVEGDSK